MTFRDFHLLNRVEVGDVVGHVERDFVLFDVAVRAHGFVVVVEGHAGGNNIDQREAFVGHGCL